MIFCRDETLAAPDQNRKLHSLIFLILLHLDFSEQNCKEPWLLSLDSLSASPLEALASDEIRL